MAINAIIESSCAVLAVGYVRVSTGRQAREGVSLEAQTARIEAWCAAHGATLLGMHEDAGISGGKTRNRPGLDAALKMATRHKAALVVYSLSRLARSTRDAITLSDTLSKAGADLVSLTERIDTTSAAGKMVFRLLAVLAEFERDLVSERTSAALAHLKAQGRKLGGPVPYGYALSPCGKRLAPCPHEQAALALMRDLRQRGHSLRQIAQALPAAGFLPRTANRWHVQTLASLLRRGEPMGN